MKNTILLVLLSGSFMFGFAQNQFPKIPPDTQEIHFTYKKTSKIEVNEQWVYADSVLFKTYFPKLKYTKVARPKASYLNAVVPIEKFIGNDKAELTSLLYHDNELYLGTHFIKENKTIISARRNDEDVKALLKKYFNKGYSSFRYRISIDYKKKTHYAKYPNVSYEKTFNEIQKEVKWFSPTEGTFIEIGNNIQKTNVALFDENISDKITFDYIFTNNTKGLVKVESIENTLELVEIHYK